MTLIKFITENRMLRNTYLDENIMFTNKGNHSIAWVGKGKYRISLIKSKINVRVWRGAWGVRNKRSTKIVLSD